VHVPISRPRLDKFTVGKGQSFSGSGVGADELACRPQASCLFVVEQSYPFVRHDISEITGSKELPEMHGFVIENPAEHSSPGLVVRILPEWQFVFVLP
jgi:hypothetical protein